MPSSFSGKTLGSQPSDESSILSPGTKFCAADGMADESALNADALRGVQVRVLCGAPNLTKSIVAEQGANIWLEIHQSTILLIMSRTSKTGFQTRRKEHTLANYWFARQKTNLVLIVGLSIRTGLCNSITSEEKNSSTSDIKYGS